MLTESVTALVGAAIEVGNRSPGQLAILQVLGVRPVSVPATNRLMPSSWVAEKVSAVVSVKVKRKTVDVAPLKVAPGAVRHGGTGCPGLVVKKPPIVLSVVSS
jgi:hypothetical protein